VSALPEASASAKTDAQIPGYRLIKRLGAGGQGSVYKAVQLSMLRPVAIKLIRPAKDPADLVRFLREARVLSRLTHENIVRAVDYGEADGIRYMVMEFVDGESVLDLLRERGRLGLRRSIEIALQVCRALAYASRHGVIHRDVKPANIVITDENRAVLVDFGLARAEESDSLVTNAGMTVGTPHYMPPEQIRGERAIDIRADLYALGATLFHMLTGQPPFPVGSLAEVLASHLKDEIELPRDLPALPADVFRIIRRAMEKKREKRYTSPDEMAADLATASGRVTVSGMGNAGAEVLDGLEDVPARPAQMPSEWDVQRKALVRERDRLAEQAKEEAARRWRAEAERGEIAARLAEAMERAEAAERREREQTGRHDADRQRVRREATRIAEEAREQAKRMDRQRSEAELRAERLIAEIARLKAALARETERAARAQEEAARFREEYREARAARRETPELEDGIADLVRARAETVAEARAREFGRPPDARARWKGTAPSHIFDPF
jgi:predicted Ser/Thr protein kinase